MPDQEWKRLAQYARERREYLGMTQVDLVAAGGPAQRTITLIETAARTSYQNAVIKRLEHALKWEPGSVRAILAGGEPAGMTAGAPRGLRYQDSLLRQIAELTDITEDERKAFIALAVGLEAQREDDEASAAERRA